jgi:hypothetical protein
LKDGVALPRHPQAEGEIFAGDSEHLVFCKNLMPCIPETNF